MDGPWSHLRVVCVYGPSRTATPIRSTAAGSSGWRGPDGGAVLRSASDYWTLSAFFGESLAAYVASPLYCAT